MDNYFEYFNNLNKDESHFTSSNDICTPMECVKEMVDKIPSEFWKSNPKVLDPCCGNGNFFAYISTLFEDRNKALKENLFFNEINPLRVANVKKYFGEEINLTEMDFLKYPFYERFDLIVANPPYALITEGKRSAKNHSVSKLFIEKSLELLNPNGYILFIVPDNFMSLSDSNDTFKLISKYDILHMNIHRAKRYFKGVGSSFVYFLVRKSCTETTTRIENGYILNSEDEVVIEKKSSYLPLYFNETVKSIFDKTVNSNRTKYDVETTSYLHATTKKSLLSEVEDKEHPYRVIHTQNKTLWSSKPHKYQDGWKCFINLTSYYDTFVDSCGMTQSSAFIRCNSKEEAETISKNLKHPLYVFLNNLCRYGNFNNIRVIQKFPKCNSNDPYKEFEITREEQELIEKIVKKEV